MNGRVEMRMDSFVSLLSGYSFVWLLDLGSVIDSAGSNRTTVQHEAGWVHGDDEEVVDSVVYQEMETQTMDSR